MRTTRVWILAAALAASACEAPPTGKTTATAAGPEDVTRLEVPAASQIHLGTAHEPYAVVVTIPDGFPGAGMYSSVERGREHPLYDQARNAVNARRAARDPEHDVAIQIGVIGSEIREITWGNPRKW
jgi:hypothetical protein